MKLLLSTFSAVPGRLVPVGMGIKNNIKLSLLGLKIKTHYFGLRPVTTSDMTAMKVCGFNIQILYI